MNTKFKYLEIWVGLLSRSSFKYIVKRVDVSELPDNDIYRKWDDFTVGFTGHPYFSRLERSDVPLNIF